MRAKLEAMRRRVNGRIGWLIVSADGTLDIRGGEDQIFPSASIIKLPILWSVFRKVEEKQLALSQRLYMRQADVVGGYGVLKNIHTGVELTVLDLCALMIHYSDNIATNMLIELAGMEYINSEIKRIGLKNTVLQRKMMDAQAKEQGLDNFTSPTDMVALMGLYRNSGHICAALRKQMEDILLGQFCNNFLAHYMPPEFRFAHKTGDLPGTLHDVGYCYTPDGRLFDIVVMCSDLDDNLEGLRFLNEAGVLIFNNLKRQEESTCAQA